MPSGGVKVHPSVKHPPTPPPPPWPPHLRQDSSKCSGRLCSIASSPNPLPLPLFIIRKVSIEGNRKAIVLLFVLFWYCPGKHMCCSYALGWCTNAMSYLVIISNRYSMGPSGLWNIQAQSRGQVNIVFYITTTPYRPCNKNNTTPEGTVWLLLHTCNLDNGI